MRKAKSNFSITLCLGVVGILLYWISLPLSGDISPQERAALIALYNSTGGDNWTNKSGWKTPPLDVDGFAMPGAENTWYGITCDPGNTTVQSIDLYGNNLNGTLPTELGNLANLQYIELGWNQFSGSIPGELGNLANLQRLNLDYNQLSGSIPPELLTLANLKSFGLYFNQLSGNIPPELGNMVNLYYLNLGSNQLSGSIPPELGNLVNLQEFDLSDNQLGGSIPLELGNINNLASLRLYSNQFSGTIPLELVNLANLQQLLLSHNQLNGTIPPELGNMVNLHYISLGSNQFSGTIPPELGNLPNLQGLWLWNNQLSGSIPPELGNLANLHDLNLSNNQLSSSIPPELGNLINLYDLNFSCNQLSGSIPPELGNLANMRYLSLDNNQLSGSIPPELGSMSNLQRLYLNYNQLSGSIPPELGNLANLEFLFLFGNKLSGSIPSNLINLINLYDGLLNLSWNALYTNDDILRAFLDSKHTGGNWEGTQTIAPPDVTAAPVSTASIDIDWTPIIYTSDTGGYRVFSSTTPGGPYTYFGMTADKTASSLSVTGLDPGTTYYFVVQTRTDTNENNQNTVDSEYSAEVSAATLQGITISGTVTGGGSGLQDVIITLSNGGGTATTDANGNYSLTVDYGWTGTATPSKPGYDFSPANRNYSNVTVNQTDQDFLGGATNQAPVADAGNPQSCIQGDTVSLNGSASSDPNGDPLTYSWQIVSKPSGSNAYLTNANSMTASLQTDAAGEYVLSLTVNDGLLDSTPDTVTITAISFKDATIQAITNIKNSINNLPVSSFNKKNDQENMIKKVNEIMDLITVKNDYCGARVQLQNSILNKTDGCAINGNPHPHDWIKTCQGQASVYPLVQDSLSLIEKLISDLNITC